jgi:hypothetical protein
MSRTSIIDDIEGTAAEAEDMVDDQFRFTQNWAQTMLNETIAFLNQLNTTSNWTPPEIILERELPDDIEIGEFEAIPPGEFTLSYATPTRPTVILNPPEGIFSFTGVDYAELLSDEVKAKVRDMLAEGGTGLSADVEQAIYDRAISRREAEDVRLYNETENYFASRNWVMPPGMLSGRLLEISKEISRANDYVSAEVMIEMARLANENQQFTVQQAIVLDAQIREFYQRNELKNLQIATTTAENLVREFSAKVEGARAEIDIYVADIQAMIGLIRGQVEAYVGQAQAFQAQADAYRAEAQAKGAIFTAQADVVRAEADVKIAEVNAEIQAFLGVAQLEASVAEAAARVSAQVAAGAMSAVNAGSSFSYNGQISAGVNYNDTESYGESLSTSEFLHSYE